MKKYEFVFLTKPGVGEKKLKEIFSSLGKEIEKVGAKVEKREDWGKKDLVYLLREEKEASFWIWQLVFKNKVDFSPVNTFLNREKNIIRYLFLADKGKGK